MEKEHQSHQQELQGRAVSRERSVVVVAVGGDMVLLLQ
jgi:hypothetical protein